MAYLNADLARRITQAKQPSLALTPAQFNAIKPNNRTFAAFKPTFKPTPTPAFRPLPTFPIPAAQPKSGMPPIFPFFVGAVVLIAVGIAVARRKPRVEVLPPLPKAPKMLPYEE
jgi:hypothetical protein